MFYKRVHFYNYTNKKTVFSFKCYTVDNGYTHLVQCAHVMQDGQYETGRETATSVANVSFLALHLHRRGLTIATGMQTYVYKYLIRTYIYSQKTTKYWYIYSLKELVVIPSFPIVSGTKQCPIYLYEYNIYCLN